MSFSTNAQVKTKIFSEGVPPNLIPANTIQPNEKIVTAPIEFEKLKNQEKNSAGISTDYKNRFAFPVRVDIDVLATAKVTEQKDFTIFTLSIKAQNALNISVQFVEFYLSPNALLSIYTKHELTDSITAKENNVNKIWATRVYQGNTLNIVLKVPINERATSVFKINQINFGYKKFGNDYFGNPGASAPCNINVVCPEGNGWENERNAVALIISGGNESCTGALVMNTCNTNVPYVLTAEHCLDGNVQNWVFQFQTWSTTCNGNTGWREDIQFNGCQLRANNTATDFALVEMNQVPQPNSGINYVGWNRNANTATSATGIHHPMGDLMKISHDFNPLISVTYQGGANNHWRATFDQGIVQHGSSGSPLFDQNHRVVGQLHGNQNNGCTSGDNNCFCTQVPVGEYGRFDISWTGGGTNATRLSNWLDPNNTSAVTTNTTNISTLLNQNLTLSITGSSSLCSSTENYTLNGAPAGSTINWTSSNPLIASITPTGTPATLTRNVTNGDVVTITATIANGANCFIPFSASMAVTVGKPTVSSVNPLMIYSGPGDENEVCRNVENIIDMNTSLNSTTTWSLLSWVGGPQPSWAGLNEDLYLYFFNPNQQTAVFRMSVNNTCGNEIYDFGFRAIDCGSFMFSIAPNPTTSDINIKSTDSKSLIKEVRITDKTGNIRKKITYSLNISSTIANISSLPADIYIVQIFDGRSWVSKQIIKQ